MPEDQQLKSLLETVKKEVSAYFEKNKLGPFPNVTSTVCLLEETKHLSESGL